MTWYCAAFLAPFAAVLGGVIYSHGRFDAIYPSEWLTLILTLVIVPLVAATSSIAIVHWRRPRRWLSKFGKGKFASILFGLIAGGSAIPLIGTVLYFANRPAPGSPEADFQPGLDMHRVSDAAIVAPISFATSLFFVWLMPLRRAGVCMGCGYDIRYSLDSGRCPECGRSF